MTRYFQAGDVVRHIPTGEEWLLIVDEHEGRVILVVGPTHALMRKTASWSRRRAIDTRRLGLPLRAVTRRTVLRLFSLRSSTRTEVPSDHPNRPPARRCQRNGGAHDRPHRHHPRKDALPLRGPNRPGVRKR
ncbi:MAG: hypothetical protein IPP12_22335 [Nitrospira sp.]|nr:hypothetical protein [Nitrospira sp.]